MMSSSRYGSLYLPNDFLLFYYPSMVFRPVMAVLSKMNGAVRNYVSFQVTVKSPSNTARLRLDTSSEPALPSLPISTHLTAVSSKHINPLDSSIFVP